MELILDREYLMSTRDKNLLGLQMPLLTQCIRAGLQHEPPKQQLQINPRVRTVVSNVAWSEKHDMTTVSVSEHLTTRKSTTSKLIKKEEFLIMDWFLPAPLTTIVNDDENKTTSATLSSINSRKIACSKCQSLVGKGSDIMKSTVYRMHVALLNVSDDKPFKEDSPVLLVCPLWFMTNVMSVDTAMGAPDIVNLVQKIFFMERAILWELITIEELVRFHCEGIPNVSTDETKRIRKKAVSHTLQAILTQQLGSVDSVLPLCLPGTKRIGQDLESEESNDRVTGWYHAIASKSPNQETPVPLSTTTISNSIDDDLSDKPHGGWHSPNTVSMPLAANNKVGAANTSTLVLLEGFLERHHSHWGEVHSLCEPIQLAHLVENVKNVKKCTTTFEIFNSAEYGSIAELGTQTLPVVMKNFWNEGLPTPGLEHSEMKEVAYRSRFRLVAQGLLVCITQIQWHRCAIYDTVTYNRAIDAFNTNDYLAQILQNVSNGIHGGCTWYTARSIPDDRQIMRPVAVPSMPSGGTSKSDKPKSRKKVKTSKDPPSRVSVQRLDQDDFGVNSSKCSEQDVSMTDVGSEQSIGDTTVHSEQDKSFSAFQQQTTDTGNIFIENFFPLKGIDHSCWQRHPLHDHETVGKYVFVSKGKCSSCHHSHQSGKVEMLECGSLGREAYIITTSTVEVWPTFFKTQGTPSNPQDIVGNQKQRPVGTPAKKPVPTNANPHLKDPSTKQLESYGTLVPVLLVEVTCTTCDRTAVATLGSGAVRSVDSIATIQQQQWSFTPSYMKTQLVGSDHNVFAKNIADEYLHNDNSRVPESFASESGTKQERSRRFYLRTFAHILDNIPFVADIPGCDTHQSMRELVTNETESSGDGHHLLSTFPETVARKVPNSRSMDTFERLRMPHESGADVGTSVDNPTVESATDSLLARAHLLASGTGWKLVVGASVVPLIHGVKACKHTAAHFKFNEPHIDDESDDATISQGVLLSIVDHSSLLSQTCESQTIGTIQCLQCSKWSSLRGEATSGALSIKTENDLVQLNSSTKRLAHLKNWSATTTVPFLSRPLGRNVVRASILKCGSSTAAVDELSVVVGMMQSLDWGVTRATERKSDYGGAWGNEKCSSTSSPQTVLSSTKNLSTLMGLRIGNHSRSTNRNVSTAWQPHHHDLIYSIPSVFKNPSIRNGADVANFAKSTPTQKSSQGSKRALVTWPASATRFIPRFLQQSPRNPTPIPSVFTSLQSGSRPSPCATFTPLTVLCLQDLVWNCVACPISSTCSLPIPAELIVAKDGFHQPIISSIVYFAAGKSPCGCTSSWLMLFLYDKEVELRAIRDCIRIWCGIMESDHGLSSQTMSRLIAITGFLKNSKRVYVCRACQRAVAYGGCEKSAINTPMPLSKIMDVLRISIRNSLPQSTASWERLDHTKVLIPVTHMVAYFMDSESSFQSPTVFESCNSALQLLIVTIDFLGARVFKLLKHLFVECSSLTVTPPMGGDVSSAHPFVKIWRILAFSFFYVSWRQDAMLGNYPPFDTRLDDLRISSTYKKHGPSINKREYIPLSCCTVPRTPVQTVLLTGDIEDSLEIAAAGDWSRCIGTIVIETDQSVQTNALGVLESIPETFRKTEKLKNVVLASPSPEEALECDERSDLVTPTNPCFWDTALVAYVMTILRLPVNMAYKSKTAKKRGGLVLDIPRLKCLNGDCANGPGAASLWKVRLGAGQGGGGTESSQRTAGGLESLDQTLRRHDRSGTVTNALDQLQERQAKKFASATTRKRNRGHGKSVASVETHFGSGAEASLVNTTITDDLWSIDIRCHGCNIGLAEGLSEKLVCCERVMNGWDGPQNVQKTQHCSAKNDTDNSGTVWNAPAWQSSHLTWRSWLAILSQNRQACDLLNMAEAAFQGLILWKPFANGAKSRGWKSVHENTVRNLMNKVAQLQLAESRNKMLVVWLRAEMGSSTFGIHASVLLQVSESLQAQSTSLTKKPPASQASMDLDSLQPNSVSSDDTIENKMVQPNLIFPETSSSRVFDSSAGIAIPVTTLPTWNSGTVKFTGSNFEIVPLQTFSKRSLRVVLVLPKKSSSKTKPTTEALKSQRQLMQSPGLQTHATNANIIFNMNLRNSLQHPALWSAGEVANAQPSYQNPMYAMAALSRNGVGGITPHMLMSRMLDPFRFVGMGAHPFQFPQDPNIENTIAQQMASIKASHNPNFPFN
jgi:hypothetical protein